MDSVNKLCVKMGLIPDNMAKCVCGHTHLMHTQSQNTFLMDKNGCSTNIGTTTVPKIIPKKKTVSTGNFVSEPYAGGFITRPETIVVNDYNDPLRKYDEVVNLYCKCTGCKCSWCKK